MQIQICQKSFGCPLPDQGEGQGVGRQSLQVLRQSQAQKDNPSRERKRAVSSGPATKAAQTQNITWVCVKCIRTLTLALSHNWRLSKNSLARACGRVRRRKPGEAAA